MHCNVDMDFTDGSVLRDMKATDTDGNQMHPGSGRGAVGSWTMIECPIGLYAAGKTIAKVLFAYDSSAAEGHVRAAVDDIEIGEPAAANR